MNKYALLDADHLEEHLSNFMIPHFSHSAVDKFVSNPLSFHKNYIAKEWDVGRGVSAIAGNAYHKALEVFFNTLREEKREMDNDELLMTGYQYLDALPANEYKLGKKYKDMGADVMRVDIEKIFNLLITSFSVQKKEYLKPIQEQIEAEAKFTNFIEFKYQDYDIPLPCKIKIDNWFVDQEGHPSFIDHKSTKAPKDKREAILEFSYQAILTTMSIEAEIARAMREQLPDDEVYQLCQKYPSFHLGVKKAYFIENKTSANRDGSPQLDFHELNIEELRPMYEAMLFERLINFFRAIADPDYMFLPNFQDPFADVGELMDYWIKIYTGDLEGFEAMDDKIKAQLLKTREKQKNIIERVKNMPKDLFVEITASENLLFKEMETMTPIEKIEFRLRTLSVPSKVAEVIEGYSCNTYLLEPEGGVSATKIMAKHVDISQALGLSSVRVLKNLLERNGKSYVAMEANRVRTGEEKPLLTPETTEKWLIPLGQDMYGETIAWDMKNASTPHIMIAGASGSGKSKCIESVVGSLLSQKVRVTILDPKYEFLDFYKLGAEVINDQNDIEEFIEFQVAEVDEIFKNQGATGNIDNKHVIIFDEASDSLLKQARERRLTVADKSSGIARAEGRTKEVKDQQFRTLEENIVSLAQKARSAGKHLILCAQRFDVNVLKGAAKANFTTRLCFTVASAVDSRVMLEQEGAEQLNGNGDALYKAPGVKEPVRMQGFLHVATASA